MNNNQPQDIFSSKGVRFVFIGTLFVLALFLAAETITLTQNFGRQAVPASDTVTISATGQAALPPDIARVSFVVMNTSTTVSGAQSATTKQANAALSFVKEQHIADKDVKTTSYNISPQYSYPKPCSTGLLCPAYNRTPKIIGYKVSESIQVTVRDLSSVGSFLAGLGKLSVQNVSGPAFTLDDTTSGYDAARADAISKAKMQAALLSKQLGVHLDKIVNFSESSGGVAYPMYAMGSSAMETKSVATPNIPKGENTYSATVSITYEIR